ncbi:biliverdin-producing heme oxygenase [Sphingobacterium sp. DN00404]|uniref:Biliverdin-producing heme oxygenase n=1 Tax=Sphingobacterium micropteri TaxID=2763501 RepID=A0ABR7YKU1_9SPHI|nr:biliverdin-producing heme oxygenase [Sphingobacterium micropteri]MBD1431933.1 biliverdin-producing heme oxygenase [Sphingobacterium micropteri]
MVSTKIKEATKQAHQELEKTVVLQLKQVRSEADYARVLKNFYAYFSVVEKAIAPYIDSNTLPDIAERRNSTYIKRDIEELGSDATDLPAASAPVIHNTAQAFGALYVLEGSIMGGPYIVQMLQKYGMEKGFHFFSGYGADSGKMWQTFTAILNSVPQTVEDEEAMLQTANETFQRFGEVFAGAQSIA